MHFDIEELKELGEEYEKVRGKFNNVPFGFYIARVSDTKLDTSMNGHIMLVWELTILKPDEFANQRVWKFSPIMKGAPIEILGRELTDICGLVCDLCDLPDHLVELVGTIIWIKISPSKRKEFAQSISFKAFVARAGRQKFREKNPLLSWKEAQEE